jgi:DNA (cytosine-5)-methyltransferase 1
MAAVATMNVLSLFSGIGGLELGLERAGMTVVGQVEINEYCRRVLAKHWPEVPRHDDVTTAVDWWRSEPRPTVHVVCGGFPCQPVSDAGLKMAQTDDRWLWPAMASVVAALRPRWVVAENVPGLLKRGLADVLDDLAQLGYRARPGVASACAVGAPHARERMFILAHTAGEGCSPRRSFTRSPVAARGVEQDRSQPAGGSWWADEPRVDRVAYGFSGRLDRIRALGNAVVPQVAEHIGRLVMAGAA